MTGMAGVWAALGIVARALLWIGAWIGAIAAVQALWFLIPAALIACFGAVALIVVPVVRLSGGDDDE